MALSENTPSKEADVQPNHSPPPPASQSSRFAVSQSGFQGIDNPIFLNKSASLVDDLKSPAPIMSARRESRRLSIPQFFSSLLPGNIGLASRRASRSNSIFAEFFKDNGCALVDYTQEAAPRLENYRNSLTMNNYMIRPSMEQLHEAQQESHPSLAPGKGKNTGAIKFGWIKGVYIRCLLNIWSALLFLRMGWVTGQCGIILSIVVVLLSTVVTVITTLSMSAICTNGHVRGGGAYYLISRSLGPEFGGVVGIILFMANAVSGSMFIIGAGEAIRDILQEFHVGIVEYPSGINDIRVSSIITLLLMTTITGIGMAFENKTQMVLLFIIFAAFADYFVGACLPPTLKQQAAGFVGWRWDVARANLGPHFRGETFFTVFAVFFPSVTGILAGANISGDLKDASSAIPKGTLLSILTTSLSYIVVMIFLGFTIVQDATGNVADVLNNTFQNCEHQKCLYGLQNNNQVMAMSSAFGPLIYAGIFAATLSSALVAIVSAPRILQALCLDGIIPWLKWFGKGYGADNDPRRALALTFVITLLFILFGELNAVAPIISNFFLAADGLINFSCFHASYVKTPGFRPSFKYYNLWVSLLGSLLCAVIMFVMNWITAVVTDVVIVALYVYISKTCPEINWGSSFQGYSYKNALYYLNKLNRMEDHVKNYRPAILVLSGNPCSRPQLVDLAHLLTKDHGLQICGHISKELESCSWNVRRRFNDLNTQWLNKKKIKAFYALVESDSLCSGVSCLFQVSGVGKMRPNILLMGFKNDWATCDEREMLDYFHVIHETLDANASLCILRLQGGTDYSKYFESVDGFPLVKVNKKKNARKEKESDKMQMPNSAVDVVISLETAIEEPPSSPRSVVFPPSSPLTQTKPLQSTIVSAAEKCQQLEGAGSTDAELSPPREEIIPPNVMESISIFQTKQKKGTIDVWWLYDDGGLTVLLPYILTTRSKFKDCKLRVFSVAQEDYVINDERLNLAALLTKFRIPFSDLTVLSCLSEPLHERSTRYFEKVISKWITKDENTVKNPFAVTRSDLNLHKKKTNQYLQMRELLEKHSSEANMIIMTLPLPRKESCPAPLFLAILEILTHDMPPFLLVRGNQSSVLTFYS